MARTSTKTLRITINLDNAAFEDCGAAEVHSILASAWKRIDEYLDPPCRTSAPYRLYDCNGNHVGEWEITGRRRASAAVR